MSVYSDRFDPSAECTTKGFHTPRRVLSSTEYHPAVYKCAVCGKLGDRAWADRQLQLELGR